MADPHTRYRKFNTKETYPEQNLSNDLCQAVATRGGRTLYLRGQCPQNLDDAQDIGSHLMGSKEPHASDNGFANNDFAAPNTNADMGGQDFGMNDTSSWDDGGALASNDGGGSDWDT